MVGLSLANSQKGWSVNLAAKHGGYAFRAQPLRERKEVVIKIPATARQSQFAAKPCRELDRQQAVYYSDHRRSTALAWSRKSASLTWPGLPATSQLASRGPTLSATRRAGRQYNVVMP